MANVMTEATGKLNGAAREVTAAAKETFGTPKSTIENLSHNIGEQAGSAVAKFQDSATEYYNNGREYVAENPVKGVAIAAAAGLICGSLLTMALRNKHH